MAGQPRLLKPHGTEAAAKRHRRRGEKPCPECREAERQAYRRRNPASGLPGTRPPAECWCCGHHRPHKGRGLCSTCYSRWNKQGFTGPGPGPEFQPAAERAAEHAATITRLPAREAADRLGVSTRTIVRYRRALREAS